MTTRAKEYFLDVVFRGGKQAAQLYVGLSGPREQPPTTLREAAAREPVGMPGYSRRTLLPTDWQTELGEMRDKLALLQEQSPEAVALKLSIFKIERSGVVSITSKPLVFRSDETPGGRTWAIGAGFVCSSLDDSGILLGWSPLERERTLYPGDELVIPVRMSI